MQTQPLVSILINVRNGENYLAEAIASVINQTYENLEIIILDDDSSDGTQEIAKYYCELDSRICYQKLPRWVGRPEGMKIGFDLCTGEYISLLDHDDRLLPETIAKCVTKLIARPDIGVVYTKAERINKDGKVIGEDNHADIAYDSTLLLVSFMTFHFRLIRRSVYLKLGNFTSKAKELTEDYDLCLRLSEITDFFHIPEILYQYRIHDTNISKNQFGMLESCKKVIEDAIARRGLTSVLQIDLKYTLRLLEQQIK